MKQQMQFNLKELANQMHFYFQLILIASNFALYIYDKDAMAGGEANILAAT